MAEIIWNKNIEPERKTEIEKYLTPYLWLIPKWCQKIYINLYSTNSRAAIETTVNDEYRWIQLDFYSAWLIESDDDKREAVLHECVHFFVNPLYNQITRVIETACGSNEEMKSFSDGELRRTVEAVTQDLTFAISQKQFSN